MVAAVVQKEKKLEKNVHEVSNSLGKIVLVV